MNDDEGHDDEVELDLMALLVAVLALGGLGLIAAFILWQLLAVGH